MFPQFSSVKHYLYSYPKQRKVTLLFWEEIFMNMENILWYDEWLHFLWSPKYRTNAPEKGSD
jgi:hypothetical protein